MEMTIVSEQITPTTIETTSGDNMERANEFQFRLGQRGGEPVVYCRGRLVCGVSAQALRLCIRWSHGGRMLLDFQELEAVDAAGLGMLADLHVLATIMGTTLQLCNLNKRTRDLLRITKLDMVFRIVGEEDEQGRALGG